VNWRHLVHVVGLLLVALSAALGATAVVALTLGDGDAWAFALTAAGSASVGIAAHRSTELTRDLTVREGYAVVALAWIAIGAAGAVPFLLTGVLSSPTAAFFESVSGFTTTGATVFDDIGSLPAGILFWRSLTQWIGGMGIIVLGVAVLPFLGVGGMQLFQAEVPGPTAERLQPRIAQTAKLLWMVYAGLTLAQVVLYLVGGLSLFDAVTHAFTTLSTGGFSPHGASLAAFDSPYVHYVTVLFMYLAGISFALHYRALGSGLRPYLESREWRFFSQCVAVATAVVLAAVLLRGGVAEGGFEPAFRHALFQTVSIVTTTGFVTADYEAWGVGVQVLLVGLMFVGGMAGSTAGGMKAVRVQVLLRHGLTEMRKALHPRAVILTRLGRKALREDVLLRVLAFVLLYLGLFAGGVLVLAFLGHDLATAVGAAAATVGNIGPGIGDVGPVDHYGWMGAASRGVLVFLMLVGRLEIFTVLLLFHPDTWRLGPSSGRR
jgi:trk system potassium uptake protein TrkH